MRSERPVYDFIGPEVLDSLDFFFYAWDPRADSPVLTYRSPSLLLLTGYSLESFQDPSFWLSLIHPDDRVMAMETLERLHHGEKCRSQYRILTRSGQALWLSDTAIPTVEKGEVVRIQGVIQDITSSKQVEISLQESEGRFQALFEFANDAIFLHELEDGKRFGHFLEVNQVASDLLGYSRQEFLAMTPRQLIPPDEYVEEPGELFQHSSTLRLERNLIARDGVRIPFEFAMACFDWQGKQVVLGIGRNISERKQDEARLQRQNAYLEALNEMTLGVINHLDHKELLEAILVRTCRLVGTEHGYLYLVDPSREEIMVEAASGIYTRYLGHHMARGEGLAGKVWESGQPLLVEDYDRWQGHSPSYPSGIFHAAAAIPLSSGDQIIGVLGIAYLAPGKVFDEEEIEILNRFGRLASVALENARLYATAQKELADRRRTESELQSSQHFVQHILDTTPNLLSIMDLKTETNTYANREVAQILGYSQLEIQAMGSSFLAQLLHPEDVALVAEHRRGFATAQEGEVREVEYRMLHKNGQWRTLHSRESIFSRDAEGNPMEILGVAEDITERKSTEEALRQGELRYHVLFTAAKRQALELSLLDQVKTAISREMDLSTIFRVVVEAVAQAFGYRLVSLYLRKGDMLHVQHQVGYDRIIEEIPIERGISGRVVRTGQPVLLEDVQRDPDFLEALPGILSEVCVPLFDQGHAVGVLNIESEGARLGEADLRILSLLAEDLNLAISKARLLAESRANEARQRVRAEELQALYETSLEINSQRDIANLLQAIVRRAVDLVGTKMGGLYLAREDGLSLELVVSYGFLGELVGTRLSAGEGLSGKILQTGQSMMVADYQAWEGQAEVYRNLAFRRVLGVPMKVGDRVIGVINLTDDSATGLFSEEEVRLVSMFADQAAIAVENERLITELKGELAERSRAELALSQSEERYRTLVQSQEEGVAEVDPDEVFRFANPSAERILGVEPGNLVGRSLREFTSPEEFDAAVLRTDARRQGKPEHYEQWIVRPSGEQRLLRLTALPRFDKDGQYMGVFGVFEDITEKRQAEEERERLASFAELNPAPILEVTVEGKVQYWNRVASERFPDLQTRGARHPFLFGLSSVSAFMSDHGLNFMVRQVRVDGAIFQQGIYTVENGRLLRIYGLDVTEQKQAEEGLRISEQRYRLLVEHNLAGVFRSTPDGRLLDCNDSFAHILGYETREEVLAQPAAQFYDNPEERAILISRLLKEGYLSNFEFKIRRRDDKLAWVLENATVIIGEAEMPIILQGTVIDISDRKDAQRELEESLQRLRQTLSETVQALASVGEMKDPYTAGHQLHVSQLASAIAREMGFDENQVEGVRVGGLVHDLGKLYVPAEILSKPGKLSPLEMSMIQTHAQASYEILKSIQFPWPIAQMALQHHERMNGSGYPHHLHGPEILVEARILAVADVVEAMANHRPYRPAHGVPKALEEVQHGQGELFDAQVVDACLRLFREKGFQFQ